MASFGSCYLWFCNFTWTLDAYSFSGRFRPSYGCKYRGIFFDFLVSAIFKTYFTSEMVSVLFLFNCHSGGSFESFLCVHNLKYTACTLGSGGVWFSENISKWFNHMGATRLYIQPRVLVELVVLERLKKNIVVHWRLKIMEKTNIASVCIYIYKIIKNNFFQGWIFSLTVKTPVTVPVFPVRMSEWWELFLCLSNK